ncbi:unnamed protein product [Tetraodon nigroviridis]|uniref:Golgi apparatus protein 1 n=1 Tax=Tetraodon nigroviridis TaxID=99883 RepID=Q4SE46_TETNG|nr:unnamed protein product [Tetraodon nigroviridis]
MVEECELRLLELQYFIARDWKLDPVLYRKCQGDASRLCHTHGWNETSEMMPPGAVFSCLYRHAYRSVEQGRRLSRDCKVEVQRILHQRALDVKLDPELQRRCMSDLGKWCSEKMEAGQELDCLQDHLEDLVADCREVVGNLTELESEDIQIEALLMRACEPVIQAHCHEVADNQMDSGDLMDCLVQNKHQKEMNDKCAVGVTHFQLIQIKDFRFSYKFKTACKEDVLKLCPNIKKKVDVVMCLSTMVRNDTLQEVKDQRVSVKCRKQLRVEEVEMDINKLCQSLAFGNAQVIECLKESKKQLSPRCHQRIFRLQEVEMADPELDYQLMRVCKPMIRVGCSAWTMVAAQILALADWAVVLSAFLQRVGGKEHPSVSEAEQEQRADGPQVQADDHQEADHPEHRYQRPEENTRAWGRSSERVPPADYRLNPVLRKACKADIPKFCQSILSSAASDTELEGQVISCLKLKYADQRLSPDCEDQVQIILQESALDYRLDPQLQLQCTHEISRLCAEEAAAQEQTGQVEECLKVNLLKIKQEGCKKEVLNMLKESKADIFVDPVLHTACALDIKHQCAAIPPGKGRRESRQVGCRQRPCPSPHVRLSSCRDVLSDGGAAGQARPPAARVQEEASGSHRHVELRREGGSAAARRQQQLSVARVSSACPRLSPGGSCGGVLGPRRAGDDLALQELHPDRDWRGRGLALPDGTPLWQSHQACHTGAEEQVGGRRTRPQVNDRSRKMNPRLRKLHPLDSASVPRQASHG